MSHTQEPHIETTPQPSNPRQLLSDWLERAKQTYQANEIVSSLNLLNTFLNHASVISINPLTLQGYMELLNNASNAKEVQKTLEFIFKPKFFTKDSPEVNGEKGFRKKHTKIYKAKDEYYTGLLDSYGVLVFLSGMYGGKTGAVEMLEQKYEEDGYRVFRTIAGALPNSKRHNRITCNEIEVERLETPTDKQGNIDLSQISLWMDKVLQAKAANPKVLVTIDEFSFMPQIAIERIVKFCKSNDIKLVMMGLEHDHTGEMLQTARYAYYKSTGDNPLLAVEHCKSFTPTQEGYDEPEGDRTMRYFIYGIDPQTGEPLYALDIEALPLIVDKVNEHLVLYVPIEQKLHYRAKVGSVVQKMLTDHSPNSQHTILQNNLLLTLAKSFNREQ